MVDGGIKKGLRNPLDEAQVRRAVLALQAFAAKKNEARTKTPLVEDAPSVSCILTRTKVPAKAMIKPIAIDLPHAIHDEGAEICLFVKDEDKKRIKEALKENPVPGVTKVMTVKKLRKNFGRFEDKRVLADAYDMFLADDRIVTYLKGPLGNKFFAKKKQPIAVRVSRKDVSASLKRFVTRTAFHSNGGVCNNVRIGHLDMSVDHIVDNVMVGMNNCAAHVAKGWHGVQSISLKTDDSIALPIYNALAPLAKLPAVGKTQNLKKRKLEEFVADKEEQEKEEKKRAQESVKEETPKKKAKKHHKKADKTAEVKEDTPKKSNKHHKAETPEVKEETPKKAKKHHKTETPEANEETSKKAKKHHKTETPEAKEETPKKAKKHDKKAEKPVEEPKVKAKASEEAPKKTKKHHKKVEEETLEPAKKKSRSKNNSKK